MNPLTRKAFLGIGATVLGMSAFGGVTKALAVTENVLRPPAVVDEGDFAARCIKCQRCIESCHTKALVPATLEDGLLVARSPKFDFHRGSCDFCGACSWVCPTAAIAAVDPEDPGAACIGVAVIQTDRCIAYSNGCQECESACPYGAITLDESGYPAIDDAVCNGCGVCENVCPALVYRSFSGGTRRGVVIVKTAQKADAMRERFAAEGAVQ